MSVNTARQQSAWSMVLSIAALAVVGGLPAVALAQDGSVGASADDQYRQGLYQRETGRPYSAIETLESLLAANPTLNRARLELAVSYYRTLNFAKARAEAQQVLNDPKTPEAVRLSVLSFLKQIDLEESSTFGKPHRFEPTVSIGIVRDSNVTAGPDNAVLSNGGVLEPSALKQSDWGTVLQAGITHTWADPKPLRIDESTARLSWNSQASLYHKAYHSLTDYNLTVLTLSTGPGLLFQGGDRGNINLQVDSLRLGGNTLALYSSLSPSYTWRLGQGELTADGQWVHRSFMRDVDVGRTGDYRSVGLAYGHLFYQGKLAVQGGFDLSNETAHDDQYSNVSHELFGGLRYRAWAGGDVFTRASWRRSHYQDVAATFTEAREETEKRVELGASHRFTDGQLDKWQLSGTVSYVDNSANISLYDYARTIATITVGRSF